MFHLLSFQDGCNTSRLYISSCWTSPLLFSGNSICRQVMNMPLPNSDGHRINITFYFEETGTCGGGVIMLHGQFFSLFNSVYYSLHCLQSLTLSLPSLSTPNSFFFFLLLLLSYSLLSFGQRYGWDHNYVLTHGVSPKSCRILTQSGSCHCDRPYCS